MLLWLSPTAWSAFSDAGSVASLSADNQAILPGSFWTPVAVFTINDDRGIDDENGDPAVHLIAVQVSFSPDPAAPANTPPLRPGDIAAVALAREIRTRANRVFNPTGVNADPIEYIATMPTGEDAGLSTTIYLEPSEERGDGDADADADPAYTTNYILLVATSPQIRDSARFRTSFSLVIDYVAQGVDTSFGPYNVFNVVNNIGDLRPVREGINAVGIPTRNQDAEPGEQGFFPPFYPLRSASHPDARGVTSAGGRVPELWPAGSARKPILGLELAGGYPNALARLTGIDLELISIGRREEWLSDGIDNDGSGEIDEESTSRYQYENKNDDGDYYIDHPGPDMIWGTDDDPGVLGLFEPGVDIVVYDIGRVFGQLDSEDLIFPEAAAAFVQQIGRNDDLDSTFDDGANAGINFQNYNVPLGESEVFDAGIDPVVRDTGTHPGVYDAADEVLYEGFSGLQNLFGSDRISNDDGDYFMFDGGARRTRTASGWRVNGPQQFVPYWDEIYIDNPRQGVRFQLDAADTLIYAGTNQWPPSFPAFYPDNDVLNYNDDGDSFVAEDEDEPVYILGVSPVIFDSNGDGIFNVGDEFEDLNDNGVYDYGFDFVFSTGLDDEIDTPNEYEFIIPADGMTMQDPTMNFMIGYAFERTRQVDPVLWSPADITGIVAIAQAQSLDMYSAAKEYLTELFGNKDAQFIVFVSDVTEDGVPDIVPDDLASSTDEIIYDNRFLGNPVQPWAELDEPYSDDDEDGQYTPSDYVLYRGGVLNSRGIAVPDPNADLPEDGARLFPLIDEEPADNLFEGIGANGRDDDGDGEDDDNNPFTFAVANGQDDDGDSVDTDGDGFVDGLERLFNSNPYDPLDTPPVDPVPAYLFVDEGIDEDTNFTPFGFGKNVVADNPTGALIDEDPVNGYDDDGDGLVDEDPINLVRQDIALVDLVDEEFEDGIDNDRDGLIDEDINNIPIYPLVDEEILDYYVNEPGGTDYFDYVKRNYADPAAEEPGPMGLGMEAVFAPRFFPVFPSPTGLLLGSLEFQLDPEGDLPLDEYYIDFNANGIYDPGHSDASGIKQDECLYAGADGIVTLQPGDPYNNLIARPVDNDGDAEDDDGNPLTHPRAQFIADANGVIAPPRGFNEDCGDSAFTFEDYEGSGENYALNGFQVYRDNGDGVFDLATDALISQGYSEISGAPDAPGVGVLNHRGDFPRTWVRINIPNSGTAPGTGNVLEQVDDYNYDYFVVMSTDDDDVDAAGVGSTVKGLAFGDDWSVKLGKHNIRLSSQSFAYGARVSGLVANPKPAGLPTDFELTKANYGRIYINDIIGYLDPLRDLGGELTNLPYVDATSSYLPVLGFNIACAANDHPVADNSGGQTGTEKLVSIRVNFISTEFEGNGIGKFDPSDLMPLADDYTSGVALFRDSNTQGSQGVFNYNIFADEPIDDFIPINAAIWDENPRDPVVVAGGHYVVLQPKEGVALPNVDDTTQTAGYDFFVAIRTSDGIDYMDGFRCFVRDGDVRFQNSRNVVNTRRATDPIAGNVPTVLSDLLPIDNYPITADSNPLAVIGIDLHDSNFTNEDCLFADENAYADVRPENASGCPARLRSVRVYFDNVGDASGSDEDFTPRDLKDVYFGPNAGPFQQWALYNPTTNVWMNYQSTPPPGYNIVALSGVALYRDAPGSWTVGGFDDPMTVPAPFADTPILLSGYEDWNFLGGFTYNVELRVDPPYISGTKDVSPVDPNDPLAYEPLPWSTYGVDGEFEGDDFFVVIRTSENISHRDDFRVGVRVEVGNGLAGTPSLTFAPDTFNSNSHLDITPPFSEEVSFESITSKTIVAPKITNSGVRTLVEENARRDASSDPFSVLGINCYDNLFSTETLVGVRVELRSLSGLETQDLNPLSSDSSTGIGLYQDHPTLGIQGVFDPADIAIPLNPPEYELNYFADHPGADGILGTYDDPGTIGVYDEGIDEVFLDDGNIPLVRDISDTVVDDGSNRRIDTVLGSPLYPLQNQPGIAFQRSVFLVASEDVDLPPDDFGNNEGPDFFVVARTSSKIGYRDSYQFRLARNGVYYSSGRAINDSDVITRKVTTNVPTYLVDVAPAQTSGADTKVPVIAIHAVNELDAVMPVTLGSVTVRFSSVDDNNFNSADLARFVATSPSSGISIWRNTNQNNSFDPDQDTFIPLLATPQLIDEVANPYARFSVRMLLPQNELTRIPSTLPLEGGGAPEFFVVILPSAQTVRGDDFQVEILPGGINYGLNAKDSGETVQTKVITFNIQQPPQISFLEPLPGTETEWPGSAPYDIRWTDFDPDDNALINLYYFIAGQDPGDPATVKTLINEEPIFEDPDGTLEDSYSWDLSSVPKINPLQILAVISDGINEATAVSGILKIRNEPPVFEFTIPVVDMEAPGDYFTIAWTDDDPDDNALIDLYLVSEDPLVSPGEIWVATGIEEDPDGVGDTYNLPVKLLLDAGILFPDTAYRVRAEISDGIVEATVFSPGTLTPVLLPVILVTVPSGTELMNYAGTIRWIERLPFGDDAAVELYWIADSALSAATRAAIGQPLEYEIPVAESQRIAQGQSSALAGEYVWSVVSPGDGGRLEFNLPADFPFDEPIRIYAKIVDEANHFRTTVSAGQFIIREHFLIVTTPAYQIPSATTVVTDNPPFAIRWEGQSKDSNAKVSLYRDVDNQGFDGTMLQNFDSRYPGTLARNIPLAAGEFLWNVTDVPLGSYYIYAVVSDSVSKATDPLFAGYSPGYIRVGQVVDSLVWVDTLGRLRLTGGGIVDPQPELPYGVEIRAIEMARRSGELFLLGSEGQVYRQDGTLAVPELNFGWDAAQDLEVVKDGQGLYVLDVLGGIRPLKEADYYGVAYFGWDIARDLASTPSEQGYLVLDGFGGVHAFGDAPQVDGPFFSWDIARDVEVTPDGSGLLVLDGFGGVHALGDASLLGSVYFGWDVARDLLMNEGGTGYYVLDAFGSIYGFGEASTIDGPSQSVVQALAAANGDAHLFLEVKTLAEWDLGAAQAIPDADPATSMIPGEATGNWVVWVNQLPGATTGRDLFYYNSVTGEQGTLVARVQTQDNPSLDGNMAVWNSRELGDWDIYLMKEMPRGEIVKISQGAQNQRYPDISEGVVVWQDYDLTYDNWDIYLYNSNQANPVAVNISPGTRGSNQQYPAIFTTAADASGERDVYVAWVDNRNGDTNQDIYLFHGRLDAQGDLVLPLETPVAVANAVGNQLEPDLGFNPYYEPGVLTLAYTDSSQGDLNMFYVFIDLETVQPIEGTRRTVPSAGPRNRDIPKDVNAQFAPAISTERVAYIDRRSGFWDVYMSDFQVVSRNAQTEMDGEIRITDTRQQVTELAAAGTKLVWLEAEGGKARLQLGSLEIVKLVQGKVFSSSKADQKQYLNALEERGLKP